MPKDLSIDLSVIESEASNYIAASDWQSLVLLIEKSIDISGLQVKKSQKNWIEALPESLKYNNHYLLWLSINLDPTIIHLASNYFSNAFDIHVSEKEFDHAFVAWTNLAKLKFYYLDRFSDLLGWLQQADKLLDIVELPKNDDIRSEFCVAYFNTLMFARPEGKHLSHWSKKLSDELLHSQNCHIKTNIYNNLIFYHLRVGNKRDAELLHKEALGVVHADTQHPFNIIMQSNIFSMVDWLNLQTDTAVKTIKKGIEHADKILIKTWHPQLYSQIVYAYISAGEFSLANKSLQEVAKYKDSSRVLDNGQYHYLLGWLRLSEGHYKEARTHLLRALDLSTEAGVDFSVAVISVCLAQVCAVLGEVDKAIKYLANAQWIGRRIRSKHIRYGSLLIQSWIMLNNDREQLSIRYLSIALKLAADEKYIVIPGWPHEIMPVLLEKALHKGIEVSYVKSLISVHGISPTGQTVSHPDWPWKIKIHCSSNIQLTVQGELQKQNTKSQKKPLELIQLLSFYPKGLSKYKVIGALYPNEDSDKATQALDTTIFRTRKLLKDKQSILNISGNYLLNPKLCHSNIIELSGLLQKRPANFSAKQAKKQYTKIKSLCESMGVVDNEQDPDWLIAERQSMRQALIKYLNTCAEKMVAGEEKEEILQYIIQVDETQEASYQNLIKMYQQLDMQIEAHKVWLQCEKVFKKVYGLAPSIKTKNMMGFINR